LSQSVDELDLAEAHRFDLTADEDDPTLEAVVDRVVERRAAVRDDDLLDRVVLVCRVLCRGAHRNWARA
jgi:hypothetical protein